ncbi:MAG: hypothetical protein WAO95_19590 [Burkholderiales bacterium]
MITLPSRTVKVEAPLRRERDALLDRIGAALDAERAALLAGDEERLSLAEREKATLLEALSRADEAAPRRPGRSEQARLRELADRNRLNGLLISERLGEVQRRRQFFEHMAGRDSIYGADGVTRPAAPSNLSSRI